MSNNSNLITYLQTLNKTQLLSGFMIICFPFFLIFLVAWHLGFILGGTEFEDPCKGIETKESCNLKSGCEYQDKRKRCVMDSSCIKIRSQQDCGQGCTWDPLVKRYNSNLYGLCRPDFRLSEEEIGSTELSQ